MRLREDSNLSGKEAKGEEAMRLVEAASLPSSKQDRSPTKIQPVVCAMVLPAWMRIPERKPPQTGVLLQQQ